MSETNGIVKSVFALTGKKGDTYEIHSHLPREEFVQEVTKKLMNKEVLVFASVGTDGRPIDVIFPHDTIYTIIVSDFSQISRVTQTIPIKK